MLVSILLPIHNCEKFILNTLKSIENQSYKNIELIIVDDCSKDSSANIVKNWSKKQKFKVILIKNTKNIGITKSLNKGLKKCSGKYVARIDDDDVWLPKKLEKQIDFMEKNPSYGYTGTFFTNYFESNKKTSTIKSPVSHEDILRFAYKKNPFAHSTIVLRLDLFRKVNGYDESIKYGQDYNLFMRCISFTKFHTIPDVLCKRVVRKKSISIDKQKEQAIQSMETRLQFIRKNKASLHNYIYLFEPFLNAYVPNWMKKIKRKYI